MLHDWCRICAELGIRRVSVASAELQLDWSLTTVPGSRAAAGGAEARPGCTRGSARSGGAGGAPGLLACLQPGAGSGDLQRQLLPQKLPQPPPSAQQQPPLRRLLLRLAAGGAGAGEEEAAPERLPHTVELHFQEQRQRQASPQLPQVPAPSAAPSAQRQTGEPSRGAGLQQQQRPTNDSTNAASAERAAAAGNQAAAAPAQPAAQQQQPRGGAAPQRASGVFAKAGATTALNQRRKTPAATEEGAAGAAAQQQGRGDLDFFLRLRGRAPASGAKPATALGAAEAAAAAAGGSADDQTSDASDAPPLQVLRAFCCVVAISRAVPCHAAHINFSIGSASNPACLHCKLGTACCLALSAREPTGHGLTITQTLIEPV